MTQPAPDLPRHFPDHAIREALVQPDNLRDLLRRVMPQLADGFDYSRIEVVPRTYLLDDWRERELDVLLRLPFRAEGLEQEVLVCILIEHQSTLDEAMPLRLLLYAVLFWEQQWREWKNQRQHGRLRLTPILPIVLHTGPQPWTTSRSLADLFPSFPGLQIAVPQWHSWLWDLTEHPPAELLAGEEAFWQALAVVRAEQAEAGEFQAVLAEVLAKLEVIGLSQRVRWSRLLQIVLHWALFRRPSEEHAHILAIVQQAQHDALLKQETETMVKQLEKTREQELLERGHARGKAEGHAHGKAEGKAEGELEALRTALRAVLQERFGNLPDDLLRWIALASVAQLQASLPQAVRVSALTELTLEAEQG